MMPLINFANKTILLALLITIISAKCAYTQPEHGLPYVYDGDAFAINYTVQICKQYFGENVCCNQHNAKLTADNLAQVDGAFSTASGGCDICAINIKRLWCEYACSPRQADFLKVSKDYYWYPDPQRPGHQIFAQEANLTVQASTACAIYQSCKRIPFVSSVSALGTPAGFLNFQGHNAIDNALQYISVYFTYNKSEGLYFGDDETKQKLKGATPCNYNGTELHGFPIKEICSCNTCEQSCNNNQGFQYYEPSVFEGFNSILVAGFYGFTFVLAGLLTIFRVRRSKASKKD